MLLRCSWILGPDPVSGHRQKLRTELLGQTGPGASWEPMKRCPMGPPAGAPRLLDDRLVMADGAELPLTTPRGTQRLVHLRDGKTMREYGIAHDSQVFLCVQKGVLKEEEPGQKKAGGGKGKKKKGRKSGGGGRGQQSSDRPVYSDGRKYMNFPLKSLLMTEESESFQN